MFKKLVKSYYKLLDEKLENGTVVVIIIAALIVSVSIVTKDTNALVYAKSNILETKQNTIYQNSILEINGIKYKIILEEF